MFAAVTAASMHIASAEVGPLEQGIEGEHRNDSEAVSATVTIAPYEQRLALGAEHHLVGGPVPTEPAPDGTYIAAVGLPDPSGLAGTNAPAAALAERPEWLCTNLHSRYEQLEVIGSGVFGMVTKAQVRGTGEVVAIKRLHVDSEQGDGISSTVLREVTLLRGFNHPNITQLKQIAFEGPYIHLMFEYMETDLHKVIKQRRQNRMLMHMPMLKKYSHDIFSGIHACFVRRIVHRDLKPQNVLVSRQGLKLGDFGLARNYSPPIQSYTHDVITLWYRAPEILLGCRIYGPEVDLWSCACIIVEMSLLMPIFNGDSEIGTIFKIFQVVGSPTENTWPGFTQIGQPNFAEHWRPNYPTWPDTGLQEIVTYRSDLADPSPTPFTAPPLAESVPTGATPRSDQGSCVELLRRLLVINPKHRATSRQAKGHAWLSDAPPELQDGCGGEPSWLATA